MRSGIAAAALASVLAVSTLSPAAARADGLYFSESIGGTSFRNEIGAHVDGAVRMRLAIGYRSGDTSIEGWFGADLATGHEPVAIDVYSPDLVALGLDVKRAFRVTDWLELYGRASLSRIEADGGTISGWSGRGLGVGTGAQIKGKVPIVGLLYTPLLIACVVSDVCARGKLGPRATAALFIDQGYDFYRLHRGGEWGAGSIDAEATRWTIGFAVGSDF